MASQRNFKLGNTMQPNEEFLYESVDRDRQRQQLTENQKASDISPATRSEPRQAPANSNVPAPGPIQARQTFAGLELGLAAGGLMPGLGEAITSRHNAFISISCWASCKA